MAKESCRPTRAWDGFLWNIHMHVVRPPPSPHHALPDLVSEHVRVSSFLISSTLLKVNRY
jgi:hypothetical protein